MRLILVRLIKVRKLELLLMLFLREDIPVLLTDVANIGEQLPNTDAKVFEVVIKVDGTDPILRPSMTTGNQIVTKEFEDVLFYTLGMCSCDSQIQYSFCI